MWKQLKATASPSNRQHGIDSGFQCSDQAERQAQNARQMLTKPSQEIGNTDIALSVITLIELPFANFLIEVTALELGYRVATGNLRHFKLISALSVMPSFNTLRRLLVLETGKAWERQKVSILMQ